MNDKFYRIKRIIAYALDWYLYSLFLIIINFIFSYISNSAFTYVATLELYSIKNASILVILMLIFHFIIFVLIVKNTKGKTIGKMLMKIHIVSLDNNELTYEQLIKRELVILFIEGYLSPLGSYIRTYLGMLIGDINILTKIYFLITGLSLFTSFGNLMFHDRIAKTKVTVYN